MIVLALKGTDSRCVCLVLMLVKKLQLRSTPHLLISNIAALKLVVRFRSHVSERLLISV